MRAWISTEHGKNILSPKQKRKKTKSPLELIEILKKIDPKRDILFVAIDTLKTFEKRNQFFNEYIKYLEKANIQDSENDTAENIAKINIRYALSYFDIKTADLWREAIPNL